MNDAEMDAVLAETLEDRRLSRSERKALRKLVRDQGLSNRDLERFRRRAFAAADQAAKGGRPTGDILEWLEDTLRALLPQDNPHRAESYFSPGETCLRAIVASIRNARKSIDVCVFTITDDRISDALLKAHKGGTKVRIISDDDKSEDRGSDLDRFERSGIDTRTDRTEAHMHHKFAIFDRETLLTGSYNWTRSAERANQENVVLTSDPRLIRDFQDCFDRLWIAFDD
jgi:phosphatidylserine/phosphatidylglycerophosphate/cardiolipin synthase-like enzyme